MKNKKQSKAKFKISLPLVVILVAFCIAELLFNFVFGSPSNFQGGDPANQPIPGNYFGIIYKGGVIVPILMTVMITMLTFVVERFIAIGKASGKSDVTSFVKEIQELISVGKISEAREACETQKGSVANVIYSALGKYQEMEKSTDLAKDQKLMAIQKEIDEATALELPGLGENLVVISTISSVATLIGLLGTVLGMIRAFSALANAGSPDSVALSAGISEALVNTALGIGSAAVAIIAYNYYTTRIDTITYSIDEAGFSIIETYASKH